jgi:hypothetical protein
MPVTAAIVFVIREGWITAIDRKLKSDSIFAQADLL